MKLHLRLGLKLKKYIIHHVLEFSQSQWLKPCIAFNIQKRIGAENNIDKWYTSVIQITKQCYSH